MEYLKTWLHYIVRLPQRAWHWYKGLYRGAPWWKKWLVGLASLLGFFVFYLFAVYVNLFWHGLKRHYNRKAAQAI